jgi:uncharacterized coiled-coil DUF342 family protein
MRTNKDALIETDAEDKDATIKRLTIELREAETKLALLTAERDAGSDTAGKLAEQAIQAQARVSQLERDLERKQGALDEYKGDLFEYRGIIGKQSELIKQLQQGQQA